jgi:hypothetical protein
MFENEQKASQGNICLLGLRVLVVMMFNLIWKRNPNYIRVENPPKKKVDDDKTFLLGDKNLEKLHTHPFCG